MTSDSTRAECVMPVIIRDEIIVGGKKLRAKIFKSESQRPLTRDAKVQAEELDHYIASKMQEIEAEMDKLGLLDMKNRPGVLRLWYEVGKRLSFVETTNLVSAQDRKYIWRALYDHAGRLSPGTSTPMRASGRNNHFRQCYLLAKKFPDFAYAESVGDWRTWSHFFDSPTIENDDRIVEWFASKHVSPEDLRGADYERWLERITNAIRNEFPAVGAFTDTTVLSEPELRKRLEDVYQKTFSSRHKTTTRTS